MNLFETIKEEQKRISKKEDDEAQARRKAINDWLTMIKSSVKDITLSIQTCLLKHAKSINAENPIVIRALTSSKWNTGRCEFSNPKILVYFNISSAEDAAICREGKHDEVELELAKIVLKDLEDHGVNNGKIVSTNYAKNVIQIDP